jgi:hypothetical protein
LMSKVHNWRVFFSSARILNFWTAEDTYVDSPSRGQSNATNSIEIRSTDAELSPIFYARP